MAAEHQTRHHSRLLMIALILGLALGVGRTWAAQSDPGVAVLLVDTDRVMGSVNEGIYGQFLEHINHSVVDGLYAEQIRGQGFEGRDFATYWTTLGEAARVEVANVPLGGGEKSLRLSPKNDMVGIRQARLYVQEGYEYNGSVWLRLEQGTAQVQLRVIDSSKAVLAKVPLPVSGDRWQEVGFRFACGKTDPQASVEITAIGSGSVGLDFVSLMRADQRQNGKLRTDLFQSLQDLHPPFIRWPGGSFASIYRWKDGIGPVHERKYHPNTIWGGYADYYGFGTEEFLDLCRRLGTEPLVVLAATNTDPNQVEYAMDWVHYLNDPATTEWGRRRAANGHPEPYNLRYFQIDNEPMNHGLTPAQYAEIVNVYGSRLRVIAPNAKIVACGQKRSNDMIWSQTVIDRAGPNLDILACHQYEYENENFQTGLQRLQDYLIKLRDYIRVSRHPNIEIAVLEWGLCRSYDWRAGLHAAGSLMIFEQLGSALTMTCPALLMRNTRDDPTWTAWIYHDHVTWFPGGGYVVEKLFRDHYAETYLASAQGTFRDIPRRSTFFDEISSMKPEDWQPGTVDAMATASADGQRIVIKAVNYQDRWNVLLVRLQGSSVPAQAKVRVFTIKAGLLDKATLDRPDAIGPVETTLPYTRDLTLPLEAHTVAVVEITAP